MKNISLSLSMIALCFLTACGGSSKKKNKVGEPLSDKSSQLAKEIANAKWCSEHRIIPEGSNARLMEILEFKLNGKFSVKYVNENTKEVVEELNGKWGATEDKLSGSINGEKESVPAKIGKDDGALYLQDDEDDPDFWSKYNFCGKIEDI